MTEQFDTPGNENDDELLSEDLDLGEGLGAIFSTLRQEQDLGELLDDEEPLEEAGVRRADPQFGPLTDAEEPPPVIGVAENPFEDDGAGAADKPSFPETEAESPKGLRGKLKQMKEAAKEEWEKTEGETLKKPKKSKKAPASADPVIPPSATSKKAEGFVDRFVKSRVKKTREHDTEAKERATPRQSLRDRVSAAKSPKEAPQTGAPTAIREEEPPNLGVVLHDAEDDISELGIGGFLRKRLDDARKLQQKEKARENRGPAGAGVDLSPPATGMISVLKSRVTGQPAVVAAPDSDHVASDLEKLLTPLSGSEITLLQAEVAADDTIFTRIDRSREHMAVRHRIGFLLGMLAIVLFAIATGSDYITSVLVHADQPSWLPEGVKGDIAATGLFALGVLFPILAIFVIADGVRLVLTAVGDLQLDDLLLGLSAGVCAIGALMLCSQGFILSAGMFLFAYLIIQFAARLLGVRKKS